MSGALPLAVTMGDPAGVGPIITWKAWQRREVEQRPFFVVASRDVMMRAFPSADEDAAKECLRTIDDPGQAIDVFADHLPLLEIACPAGRAGHPEPGSVSAIVGSIETAVAHVKAGSAAAVVTNPIAKSLLYRGGFRHPGHTEYLAELAGPPAPRPVMMLVGGGLRVALATIHRPLASISSVLTQDLIVETGRILHAALKRDFGIATPSIGLCGLNPHAGEDGELGREEIDIVNPAAARLRSEGIDISNARPGDTIFHEARQGAFDAVLAMYHDQGLIPVKTLDMWGGVNVTLGLPFVRTSPDHGVAYDAAVDSENARPESLIAALELADRMARGRAGA